MNKKEMTKIAKECGCEVSELPELKCPSEFDYTYDLEECPGEYIGDICEECWKNAEKPDPDDTVYRLTKKAFASDKEYMEYLKRCADAEPVQPQNQYSRLQNRFIIRVITHRKAEENASRK